MFNVQEKNVNFNKEEDINNNKHENKAQKIPEKNLKKFINSLKEN